MTDGKRDCGCKWMDALGGRLVRCKYHLALNKHEKAAKKTANAVFRAEMVKFLQK